jgi:hypothetical protein
VEATLTQERQRHAVSKAKVAQQQETNVALETTLRREQHQAVEATSIAQKESREVVVKVQKQASVEQRRWQGLLTRAEDRAELAEAKAARADEQVAEELSTRQRLEAELIVASAMAAVPGLHDVELRALETVVQVDRMRRQNLEVERVQAAARREMWAEAQADARREVRAEIVQAVECEMCLDRPKAPPSNVVRSAIYCSSLYHLRTLLHSFFCNQNAPFTGHQPNCCVCAEEVQRCPTYRATIVARMRLS